jgi:hypothetical protein
MSTGDRGESRGIDRLGLVEQPRHHKDGKFGRPETAGVAAMIAGNAARHESDARRMAEALVLFDTLQARMKA